MRLLTPEVMARHYSYRPRIWAIRDIERFIAWFKDAPESLAYWQAVKRYLEKH